MIWFGWFRRDRAAVEDARAAEELAQAHLDKAHQHLDAARRHVEEVRSTWPKTLEHGKQTEELLTRNSLSARFLTELHGGKPA